MILERLYLENYKQFREPTELLPPEGAIGVVGTNGSGKTTIFEAILWAFFGSRGGGARLSNDSIPWSGGSTAERTLVEVTLNVGGVPYKVARALQRGKTEAKVFVSGEPLVSGSSEVSEWVQRDLLGMDRTAFEATFFARQKELEFFAGVTGVERQREIARILSIDQVEEAQRLLRADRKDLLNESKFLEAQLESVDHDQLVEELKQAREEHAGLEAGEEALREKLKVAEEEVSAARAEGEKLEAAYRRHNELANALSAAEVARERAAERAAEARAALAGLDEDEKTVERLLPMVEGLPEVVAKIEVQEQARRRQDRREDARKEACRRRAEAHRAVVEASNLLEDLDAMDEVRALFAIADEARRMREAEDVLRLADGLHTEAEERLVSLRDIKSRFEELGKEREEVAEVRMGCEAASEEIVRLEVALGELDGIEGRLARLGRRERSLELQSAQQKGLADADDRDAEKLEKAAHDIEASEEVARCPTCRRGFEGDEHREVLETLLRQTGKARARAEEARTECRRLDGEAKELLEEISGTEKLREEACALQEKLAGALARRETFEKNLARLTSRVEDLEERLDGVATVTDTMLEEAGRKVDLLRSQRDAYPNIKSLLESHEAARDAAVELEQEIEDLQVGPAYDPLHHETLRKERTELERLLVRVEMLRGDLQKRPDFEERLKNAGEERREAADKVDTLREELNALAFDEGLLLANRERGARADKEREELRGARGELAEELRRVKSRAEGLEGAISRYQEQRKVADEKASAAAKLGEMDKLLSEFYRELTARVRPALEDEAGKLVKLLTDGRYERVEFDQNYGVRLFDGLSDAHEISRFSGGEADVVSLCARVALSKMISAKGSEALGFVVLDEVFGALDAGRRRNVLLALDRLKETFGQIFIISHVADVQESALFDELWIVEEDEEGKSTVRRQKFNLGGEPVESLANARGS